MNFLSPYSAQIAELCRRYSVERLFAFGSVLTDRFNDESDIDLIVDIAGEAPLEYADNYFNLKFALSDLFGRPVDLLENKALRNPRMREHIESSKVLIYTNTGGVAPKPPLPFLPSREEKEAKEDQGVRDAGHVCRVHANPYV